MCVSKKISPKHISSEISCLLLMSLLLLVVVFSICFIFVFCYMIITWSLYDKKSGICSFICLYLFSFIYLFIFCYFFFTKKWHIFTPKLMIFFLTKITSLSLCFLKGREPFWCRVKPLSNNFKEAFTGEEVFLSDENL